MHHVAQVLHVLFDIMDQGSNILESDTRDGAIGFQLVVICLHTTNKSLKHY